jgi:alpha/beta superfamily hydrolase
VNARTERFELAGAAGAIEALRDQPDAAPRGVVVIAHPHPLFGGTMDNKVVQTLARAFVQCGWTAVRFNFRGVGASAGGHDKGPGEIEDMQRVVRSVAPGGPLALAGFSFGSYVAAQVLQSLWPSRPPEKVALVGTAVSRFPVGPLPLEAHDRTLVVHGEEDDTVLLADVMNWARPQSLPVTVVPGVGHFFHGQLPLLKSLVVRHLRS